MHPGLARGNHEPDTVSCPMVDEAENVSHTENLTLPLTPTRSKASTTPCALRFTAGTLSPQAATKLPYLILRGVKNQENVQSKWIAAMTQFAISFGDRFSIE